MRRYRQILLAALFISGIALYGGAAGAAETGGGHHGPAVVLFGHELTSGQQFLIKLLNFSLFAGALVFALKGVLASAFRLRAKELQEQLSQADRLRGEAESKLADLEQRMGALQVELDGILAQAESDAQGERDRIVSVARQEAEAILAQVRFEIVSQQRQVEQELRTFVAERVVASARQQLEARISGGEAAGVLDRAIAKVGGV